MFYQITEKIYKKRAEFGNDSDYENYMVSVLQPGDRVKMLRDVYSGVWVNRGDVGTVTSSVYVGMYGDNRVKVDFDSGHRDVEVMCRYIEIIN